MTTSERNAAQAAADVLSDQARTLVAMAGLYRDSGHLIAVQSIRSALLSGQENDRHALATGVAILAVLADAGEIGTPAGKLVVDAGALVAAMVALQVGGCQDPPTCPGVDQPPAPGASCPRCMSLGKLQEETGLTGKEFLE